MKLFHRLTCIAPTIISLMFLACNSSDQKDQIELQEKLHSFLDKKIKSLDARATVDSVRLISLDTVTDKIVQFAKLDQIWDTLKEHRENITMNLEEQKDKIKWMRLLSQAGSNDYKEYQDDFDELRVKYKKLMHTDSLIMQRLDKQAEIADKADSTQLRLFEAKGLYQIKDPTGAIGRDTFRIIVTKNKEIVNREDFMKNPQNY